MTDAWGGNAVKNPVLEAIAARRSIRAYAPDQITQAQLDALIRAAQQSPSALDRQSWHFSVVQNSALMDEMSEAARLHLMKSPEAYAASRFSQPGYNVFYHAPTVIFISLDPDGPAIESIDAGIAAQNIALAATGMGLGSVILGMPREAFRSERGDEFRKALHFPDKYDFAIAAAVGTATATKDAHEFKPDRVSIIK
jgi:nitroreductase